MEKVFVKKINDITTIYFSKLDKFSYSMTTYDNGFKVAFAIISNNDFKELTK